ncbi:MAG: outer membrane lipoprotein carrier protein LolA [Lutibacter sp.]|jgi:outer membrane lipoprotein-sorting protein|nr:outer membrane lipoprotein carrier protein LolA [Lutibacter sp.]
MKKIITLVIVLLSINSYSQRAQEARALLDQASKKALSYSNIYIEFNHKLDNNVANVHQETMGNLTLKGDKYHLNYMGTEQVFDGAKSYLIIHEDEEVIIQKPSKNSDETITPSKMFSFYKTGFNFAMDALKTIKGVKIQYVKLTPIDSKSDVKNVLVGVDAKTNHIYDIIETGNNKTVTTLEVRTFKTNQPVSDKLFIFDMNKYKNQKKYSISEPK